MISYNPAGSQAPPPADATPMQRRHVLLALNWYHPKLHQGVALFAREQGWHLNTDLGLNPGAIPWGWRGDGIITQTGNRGDMARFVRSFRGAKAFIGEPEGPLRHPHVANDDRRIAALAARHFLDRGFTRFATHAKADAGAHPRLAEFARLVGREGFACPFLGARVGSQRDWAAKCRVFRSLLGPAAGGPAALFCLHDNAAADAESLCLDAGLAVPGDVAILGVRNDALVCDAVAIPLSSVDNDLREVGRAAAAALARRMEGAGPPALLRVAPVGVVTRQSTDILAVADPEVARALAFMRDRHRTPITVNDVLARAGVSGRALYAAFHRSIGRTPAQELLRLRVETARRLLAGPRLNLEAVAHAAGFGGVRVFHAAFRKTAGLTPARWRKMHAGEAGLPAELNKTGRPRAADAAARLAR